MVSLRCKMVVKTELENLGIYNATIGIGDIKLNETISSRKYNLLKNHLTKAGFEIICDRKSILVEKIKNVIIEMVHYTTELPDVKYSIYISEKLNYDYTYLSNIFSEVRGITIEHFIIFHKVEHIKELLIYNELTLSEIAQKLQYCNVAHLSGQFKKTTGLTPRAFRSLKQHVRVGLEET
ncbi:MAG: helix-turn-helix domain-containing protein [Saprospiraceae bacterium]